MAPPALEVTGLDVSIGSRPILRGVSLTIAPGEVHVLMGPNGGGKTTLLKALMGMPCCRVTAGSVFLDGREVTALGPDERARAGLTLAFQRPPAIRGVTLGALASRMLEGRGAPAASAAGLASSVAMKPFLSRELNVGLSGGETKRSEMLQLLALSPRVALFDEPESGVDLDNISVVGEAMRTILGIGRDRAARAGLIVTHTGHILERVPAHRAHVLIGGRIVCRGLPQVLFEDVRKHGYEGCLTCRNCLGS